MRLSRHLKPINIYFILLIFSLAITVNAYPKFMFLNTIFYVFIHFIIIYIGIYYNNIYLYFVYFFSGIFLDIFLLNEIGPHAIVFMLLVFFFDKSQKILSTFNPFKIIIVIFLSIFLSIFSEQIVSQILFNYKFSLFYYLKIILLSFILLFPTFYFFQKIDNFKS